jgi:hypothetical protein
MDLQASIRDFVGRAKELGLHLRSHEAETLGRVDLHILEVQLYLLEKKLQKRQEANRMASSLGPPKKQPDFAPFFSDKDDEGNASREQPTS